MGVEYDVHVWSHKLSCSLDCLVDDMRSRSTRSILEAERIERNLSCDDFFEYSFIEIWIVSTCYTFWKAHHCNCNFVLEASVMDSVTAVDKVVDIVEGIEVSDCCHTMLLKELGMEFDHISWL